MKKLDYHEFYEYIWMSEDFVDVISDNFIDAEEEFIREFTLQLWRLYDLKFESNDPLSSSSIKRVFSILFSSLALFTPKLESLKPISDKGRF
ncbi:hypothetical protein Phi4:1_gp074 [Cellulophaga phage phi4:1]|uniref:Uncharacterized protein n=5 Tax=Lightbulbvirus TaxID=1918522 RepID=A0A0S2MWI2_9CAUD|nr:hypothetical protein Phi4:1_gp074 [Cellulophaga phage phi4:1]YP_008241571.1 hypothetical protein Phi17:2_gp076 [Cellulophaga phage phi17:2]ALO80083.1 hypothetical protein Phi4113_074 [Cellulophaga phage phi4:1_13]ALO80280.1 hypothetical protein Phi4118_074 [Cellulophaga phage phi4:1_18]ALO80479.1 hypothetical protein Phi17218_076 [Cellulophaga phage phi17:2_18]AGO47609.1 hypothetical protein Phi17:2_gp076 [Cellulophaga phage phi17:2]AGO49487.1 hypothetical protein Phi4:1_gp074 [Cellulophag